MPYNDIGGNLTRERSQHDWQIRIAVDPSALRADKPNNKIDAIKSILAKCIKEYGVHVNIKLWTIPNDEDFYDRYDGATSKRGKDSTQRGKAICIYVADTENALTANQYKIMLLNLWRELQKAKVPLNYMMTPGDRKITGPFDLPTPFSITSISKRAVGKEEWKDLHGILFKKFEGWDKKHPILKINFTEKDLKSKQITFDPVNIAHNNGSDFTEHQSIALTRLRDDIENIKVQNEIYRQLLISDDLKDFLKEKITSYNEGLKQIEEIDDRGPYQEQFDKELNSDKRLQFFLNSYPHAQDSAFTEHPAIHELKDLKNLEERQIDRIYDKLRTGYNERIKQITIDFERHLKRDEAMRIDWSQYIPNYTAELLTELIEKNPAQMQAIYRRVILLEQEKSNYEEFKKHWLQIHYSDAHIYDQLTEFTTQVSIMEKNLDRTHEHNNAILKNFKALQRRIESEIMNHPKIKLEHTPYPAVLRQFTSIAKKINQDKVFTVQEITYYGKLLDKALANKKPMSKALKMTLCGVLGVLVGAALGFVVGAAWTFWSGSFGALPGAIIGGIMGMNMAQGILLGEIAAGAGLATGLVTGTAGFFNARRHNNFYQRKENDKKALEPEIQAVYNSLRKL